MEHKFSLRFNQTIQFLLNHIHEDPHELIGLLI
jgi:hypothetical protein